jgi:hypothetical protein
MSGQGLLSTGQHRLCSLFDAYFPLGRLTAGFWWMMPLIYLSTGLPAGPAPFQLAGRAGADG